LQKQFHSLWNEKKPENMFSYRFTVGAITIASGILALLCIIVGALAVEFNFDSFSNPVLTLQYSKNHQLAKWFLLLDLFGYYLLLLPVIFFIHQQYKYRSPWMPLFTFSGAAYVLVGSIGAAMLAEVWPGLMQDYLNATAQNQETIALQFQVSTIAVTKGLWNILEVLFAAAWWIGVGSLLYRDKKITGMLSIATGAATFLDAIANMAGLHLLAELGLNIYLLLGIIWPLVIGVTIIKQSGFGKITTTTENEVKLKNEFKGAGVTN
jgi:hypothetical protein